MDERQAVTSPVEAAAAAVSDSQTATSSESVVSRTAEEENVARFRAEFVANMRRRFEEQRRQQQQQQGSSTPAAEADGSPGQAPESPPGQEEQPLAPDILEGIRRRHRYLSQNMDARADQAPEATPPSRGDAARAAPLPPQRRVPPVRQVVEWVVHRARAHMPAPADLAYLAARLLLGTFYCFGGITPYGLACVVGAFLVFTAVRQVSSRIERQLAHRHQQRLADARRVQARRQALAAQLAAAELAGDPQQAAAPTASSPMTAPQLDPEVRPTPARWLFYVVYRCVAEFFFSVSPSYCVFRLEEKLALDGVARRHDGRPWDAEPAAA